MEALSICVLTWNVATRPPEQNINDLLNIKRFKSTESFPDFFVIGLQEVKSQPHNFVLDSLFNDPWTNIFTTTLSPYNYVKVKTNRLVGLLINVYCLRKHVIHLRDIHTEHTKTGLLGLWGNKGAVTIRLQIYGCLICFVNCHLAPHDNSVKERIDDYNNILQNQKFTVKDTVNILFHDYVFWFGDLNFRLNDELNLSAEEIILKIENKELSYLLEHDQLKQVMSTGEAFGELVETDPLFEPTYKYNINSQLYDSKRRPAWTDRILFRVNKHSYENFTLDLKQLSYKSLEQYTLSDHKPVVSEFSIKVFHNYTERQVKINPIGKWMTDNENKALLILDVELVTSIWDWVGLYKENFTSLDEYLGYVYLSTSVNENIPLFYNENEEFKNSDKRIVTFPDTTVLSPGYYQLIYFTQNSNSILGISERFYVEENPNCRVPLDW